MSQTQPKKVARIRNKLVAQYSIPLAGDWSIPGKGPSQNPAIRRFATAARL